MPVGMSFSEFCRTELHSVLDLRDVGCQYNATFHIPVSYRIKNNQSKAFMAWLISSYIIKENTFHQMFFFNQVCCCCCEVASVVSDSVRPHRGQPTRLPRPWDSPGRSTGVGCHFLLQCMKVKSESEVTQSCPTLDDPMDCSPPGSSIHGIFQARVLEWVALPSQSRIMLCNSRV